MSRSPSAPVLFAALGDATRLSLLRRLSVDDPLSITRLSEGTGLTRQAITKHLNTLGNVGLVRHARRGRGGVWGLGRERLGAGSRSSEGVRRAVASARLAVTLLHELFDRLSEQGERERLVEGEAKRRLCRAISFQPAVAARRLGRDEHRDVLLERREVDEPTFVSRAAVLVERNAVADALGGFRRRALDHLRQRFEPRAHRGRLKRLRQVIKRA